MGDAASGCCRRLVLYFDFLLIVIVDNDDIDDVVDIVVYVPDSRFFLFRRRRPDLRVYRGMAFGRGTWLQADRLHGESVRAHRDVSGCRTPEVETFVISVIMLNVT